MNTFSAITVEPNRLCYTMPILHPQDKDVIEYAMAAYSFVLEPGEYTWQQFAAAIAECCSLENPRNKAVHDTVLSCHDALAEQEVVVEEKPQPPRRNFRDKPNKRFPFVFIGLWRSENTPLVTRRCKTLDEAKDAARNFFCKHTTGSVKGAKIKLLDGTTHIFDANGNYFLTVPPV